MGTNTVVTKVFIEIKSNELEVPETLIKQYLDGENTADGENIFYDSV